MKLNFKTSSHLEWERKILCELIADAKEELKQAKRIKDTEWEKETLQKINLWKREKWQIDEKTP